MALSTTLITGAVATGAGSITVSGFTAPTQPGGVPTKVIGQFVTGERVLISDTTNSPTLAVVRGYMGTTAVPHSSLEGFQYGLISDTAWLNFPVFQQRAAVVQNVNGWNSQAVTVTGATGTTAAIVTVPSPGFLSCTGAASSGVNLPIPNVGDIYVVKNLVAGSINVYCVGGTIGTTTGTTANAITNTGTTASTYQCYISGTWTVAPLSQ